LFIVEALIVEPALFDTYIAFDPSLWWNDEKLLKQAGNAPAVNATPKRLYVAMSSDGSMAAARQLTKALSRRPRMRVWSHAMPEEKHATIYHPAALRAFRLLFPPEPRP
jgi:hypothetical protein